MVIYNDRPFINFVHQIAGVFITQWNSPLYIAFKFLFSDLFTNLHGFCIRNLFKRT
nr:hypothetical protein Iba_chr08eCG3630 [Ipomoea batatas]